MNIYPTSNAQAQMTHAAWGAAEAMDYDALEEFEIAERLNKERRNKQEDDYER